MNSAMPPIFFAQPAIALRRRERNGFSPQAAIPPEKRQQIAQRISHQFSEIQAKLRTLSVDEQRAIFLRLTHDRPITKSDLTGTGLSLMFASSDHESFVVPRKAGDISAFQNRIEDFAVPDKASRPTTTALATKIQNIQIGDPTARLSVPLASAYQHLIKRDFVQYEIEISSFESNPSSYRKEINEIIQEIRRSLGNGVHGGVYETEVSGRGARMLIWSTGEKFRDFVHGSMWQRKITLFDERPKFETFSQVLDNFNIENVIVNPPNDNAETICVIDTGIAAGNPFLKAVLRTDISKSFFKGASPVEDACGHGSGVASLSAFYPFDIGTGATNQAAAFVASARITDDDGQLDSPLSVDPAENRMREARLLSSILRSVVEEFSPHGVRIFVLAFQIVGHVWSKAAKRQVPRNAWLARTIDQLSRDYDVIFVNITGNLSASDIRELISIRAYPEYLLHPIAKIHDPGQAALAVTVGSIAHSSTVAASADAAIALVDQPSPFTRSGPGFGDAMKPDFVERGGNLIISSDGKWVSSNQGTNVVMASGRLTPAIQRNNGTSFAAPRVANGLARISSDLREIGVTPTAPLLRAFLAMSAECPAASQLLAAHLNRTLLGHGIPDGFSATECKDHSVILFWQGKIKVDHNALFRIHIPEDFAEFGRGKKRIVVAVASSPPVQSWGVEEYLGAEMKFRLYRGDKTMSAIESSLQRTEGEQNVAPETTTADMAGNLGINARSVGTLQRDCFEWSDHNISYSAEDYTLSVTLIGSSWVKPDVEIPIGLVVRVEDSTTRFKDLYNRVAVRNRARVQARG